MKRSLALGLATLLASLASVSSSHAYCFTTTCGLGKDSCNPPEGDPCGIPVRWHRECVGLAVQRDGSVKLPLNEVISAVHDGFGAWLGNICGDAPPGIAVIDMGTVACSRIEQNDHAGNVNLVVFRDAVWPYPDKESAVALTTVSYEPATGRIVDVDMEINTANFNLTTTDPTDDYDLVGIITHESGHFFGLAHSGDETATMNNDTHAGTTELRTLETDDITGMCTLYPPAFINTNVCNPIPDHGFAAECAAQQYESDCAVSVVGARSERTSDGRMWWSAMALAAVCHWVRRTRSQSKART